MLISPVLLFIFQACSFTSHQPQKHWCLHIHVPVQITVKSLVELTSTFFAVGFFLPIDLRPKKCTVWAGLINSHRTSSIYHKPNGPTSNATLRLSHRIPYGFSWWNRHRSPAVQVTGGLRRPRPGRQRAGRCRSVVASPGGLCSAGAMQPIPLGYPWDTLGIPLGQWLFWWLLLGLSAWEIPCHNKPQ